MDKMDLIKFLLSENNKESVSTKSEDTFLEIGKNYLFRTVTMIYTGKLEAINASEFLVSTCCWIAETARWQQAVLNSDFKEIEPYPTDKKVILARGSMLDVVEIKVLPTVQKP